MTGEVRRLTPEELEQAAELVARRGATAADAAAAAGNRLHPDRSQTSSAEAGPVRLDELLVTGPQLFLRDPQPLEMAVDPLFPRRRQGVVYGMPGAGKSMLMRHVVNALRVGGLAFGRFQAQPMPVLWITAEEAEDDLVRGTAITVAGDGFVLADVLEGLSFLPLREADFTLASEDARHALETLLARLRPGAVVLDAQSSLGGVDLTNEAAVRALLRWGSRVASGQELLLVWIAHDKKPQKDDPGTDLHQLYGNIQNAGLIDFAYRVLPVPGSADLILRCTKMRGADRPKDVHLEAVIRPNELHGFRAVSSMSRMSRDPDMVDAIRRHLERHPGATMSQLRDTVSSSLRKRPVYVAGVVQTLVSEGLIENRGNASRFALHWRGDGACPGMSRHVPDTPRDQHVPMSRPPVGGADPGHADTLGAEVDGDDLEHYLAGDAP